MRLGPYVASSESEDRARRVIRSGRSAELIDPDGPKTTALVTGLLRSHPMTVPDVAGRSSSAGLDARAVHDHCHELIRILRIAHRVALRYTVGEPTLAEDRVGGRVEVARSSGRGLPVVESIALSHQP